MIWRCGDADLWQFAGRESINRKHVWNIVASSNSQHARVFSSAHLGTILANDLNLAGAWFG